MGVWESDEGRNIHDRETLRHEAAVNVSGIRTDQHWNVAYAAGSRNMKMRRPPALPTVSKGGLNRWIEEHEGVSSCRRVWRDVWRGGFGAGLIVLCQLVTASPHRGPIISEPVGRRGSLACLGASARPLVACPCNVASQTKYDRVETDGGGRLRIVGVR